MDFIRYITENALILLPVLYIIGMFLKNTPFMPDWTIPWILLICGIFGGCVVLGFNSDGITQGILCAGMTVFANQLIKQTVGR